MVFVGFKGGDHEGAKLPLPRPALRPPLLRPFRNLGGTGAIPDRLEEAGGNRRHRTISIPDVVRTAKDLGVHESERPQTVAGHQIRLETPARRVSAIDEKSFGAREAGSETRPVREARHPADDQIGLPFATDPVDPSRDLVKLAPSPVKVVRLAIPS